MNSYFKTAVFTGSILLALVACRSNKNPGDTESEGKETGSAYSQGNSTIVYVDVNAPQDGDGKTWTTAYKDLQDALDHAQPGTEIQVAAGIYKPTAKVDGRKERHRSFQLINGVSLYGGFKGDEEVCDQRDWLVHESILCGDLHGDDDGFTNSDENCYHVVTGNHTNPSAIIDGFIIRAGNANDDKWPHDGGGGMNNSDGSPTINNCTFERNQAFADGGGMRNWGDSKPVIRNCTFRNNRASQEGGGMMNGPESRTIVTDCTFSMNSAGEDGGGMYNNESAPKITNSVFSDNQAALTGGGMYNVNDAKTLVTNCTFRRNSAAKAGGAICNTRSSPSYINCIIWGNSAATDPEIHNAESSMPEVTYSNVAGGYAGAGNIDADPFFTDDALRLSTGSPCADAGNNGSVPEEIITDPDGNPRIINEVVDMGAYEVKKP